MYLLCNNADHEEIYTHFAERILWMILTMLASFDHLLYAQPVLSRPHLRKWHYFEILLFPFHHVALLI